MVNCAGIVGATSIKTEDISVAEFDKVYEGIIYHKIINILLL